MKSIEYFSWKIQLVSKVTFKQSLQVTAIRPTAQILGDIRDRVSLVQMLGGRAPCPV